MRRTIDLLEGAIFPALWRLAAPLMMTALIEMAYSLTDMMWIGRIDSNAVAAIGTVGFLLWIGHAVAIIPRTGLGVLTSQRMGREDEEGARRAIEGGIQLGIALSVLYIALTELALKPFVYFFQLGEAVNGYAVQYGHIVLPGLLFMTLNILYSQAYQSIGNSVTPFRINAIGLVVNMFLDPLLIFGVGVLPPLGVSGAALATVFAQAVVFALFLTASKRAVPAIRSIRLRRPVDGALWRRMLGLGVPVFLLQSVHATVSLILNRFIAVYGATAVAAASIGAQLESVSWMTAEGFSVAITAMIGQNYGAQNEKRVKEASTKGLVSMLFVGVGALLLLIGFRTSLFRIFLPGDAQGILLGAQYLLIFGLSQPFLTLEISASACFNGVGRTRPPSAISALLNLLRIPGALLLMPSFGVLGIWAAMSFSTVAKGTLIVLFWQRCRKNLAIRQQTF
ncbi:MAG: MATE family efflux transporter [Ndongobacter sp.]|nr:MATE family efflux transporter [Ndongobacter sp.]